MARTLLLFVSCLLAPACAAQGPGDDMPFSSPDAGLFTPDPPPEASKPDFTLDDIDASTPYMRIPVRGSGPARGQIIYETATKSGADAIGADGTFCIDVPLEQGIANMIWFRVTDADGTSSDEKEVTVTQEGDPPTGQNQDPQDPEPTFRNIARGGVVSMNVSVKTGQPEYINDGDPDTFAELDNAAFKDNDYVKVAITEAAPIDHIRVTSTDDCPVKKARVIVSDAADPDDPYDIWNSDYPGPDWWEIGQIDDDSGDVSVYPPFGAKPIITHVGLMLLTGCRGQFLATENFEIQEIEALTEKDEPPQGSSGDQGPTCDGGAPL